MRKQYNFEEIIFEVDGKTTLGLKVVFSIAAEAENIHSIELEPEHFFLAMLKVEDVLGSGIISRELPDKEVQEATARIAAVVEF